MTSITIESPQVKSINPATGEVVATFAYLDEAGREAALAQAQSGYETWRGWPIEDRADALRRVARGFRASAERLARDITLEMGKPIKQARGEVEKCALVCEWYADHGAALIADEATSIDGDKAYVSFLPIGVVLAVMPWNFPLWQVVRAAAPIMLAGNGVLLKHAPNVFQSAANVAEVFAEAGVPLGAFGLLNVDTPDVAPVIADRRIAAVTLTGSVRAGAAVAAEAGRNVKKSVLELGGSDPFIVLADADLDAAVAAAVIARFQNSGQVCIAAKRFILEESIAEAFTRKFVEAVGKLRLGDPLDEATDVGPMARRDLRDELHEQVQRSIAAGATLLCGGRPSGSDAASFYEPTVLADVRPGMAAYDEETFGPVAALIVAKDEQAAVDLANDSEFGLSGSLWTTDAAKAKRIARQIESGGVFINGFPASDPRVPIGGIKKSGYGRELSHFGVREFTNAQIVWRDRV
jgi:succinate-semialdehyde dehydrogenase